MADQDLFSIEGDAILEEAPDYETGYQLLQDTYLENKDKENSADTFAFYNTLLSKQFNQPENFDYLTTKDEIAPVSLEEIEVDDPYERINEWEKQNLQLISEETEDPYVIANRDKINRAIQRAARSERRLLNGEDTLDEFEARQRDVTEDEGFIAGTGRKVLGGAVSGIAGLLGFEETEEALTARPEDESFIESVGGDVAAGVGFVGGLVGSGLAGAGAGAAIGGPPGAIAGSAIGAASYVAANATEAILDAFKTSYEIEGDTGRAYAAATIETGSQVIQAALGGKAVVGLGKRILGKSLKKTSAEIVSTAAVAGGTGALGAGLSTTALQVGTDNFSVPEIIQNASRGLLAGLGLGTIASGGAVAIGQRLRRPPDQYTTNLNTVNAATEKGDNFVTNDVGNVFRTDPQKGLISVNYDGAFEVPEIVAKELTTLKESSDPEGNRVNIYTNEYGELAVKNPYVGPDLKLKDTPQNLGEIILKTGSGDHIVEANRPRATEDGGIKYTSRITKKSVGAAAIEETKERGRARRLRESPILNEQLREVLGGDEGPGLDRYVPITNLDTKNTVDAAIAQKGLAESIRDFLLTPFDIATTEIRATGIRLEGMLEDGYANAKKYGTQKEAETLAELLNDVAFANNKRATDAGQMLQVGNISRHALSQASDLIRSRARKQIHEEVAAEEGISVKDVEDTSIELQTIEDQLAELNQKQDPEVVQLDSDIVETERLIAEVDKVQGEELSRLNNEDKALILRAENELKELKAEQAVKEQEVQAAQEEAAALIEDLNRQAEKLKERLEAEVERAKKELQSERNKRLVEIRDLRKKLNEDSKAGKSTKATEKKIEKLEAEDSERSEIEVTPENLVTPKAKEVRKSLQEKEQKIKVLKDTEAKIKTRKPPEKVETSERFQALEKFIRDKKEGIAKRNTDNVGGKKLQLRKQKLKSVLSNQRNKRASALSKFDDANELAYRNLTAKAKKLRERKTKINQRTQKKVDQALPESTKVRLQELQEALALLPEGAEERLPLQKEIDQILHEAQGTHEGKLSTYTSPLTTYYVANALFRGGTLLVNFGFNAFKLLDKVAGLTVTGLGSVRSPADGLLYLKDFLDANSKSGLNEAGRVFFEGADLRKTRVKTREKEKFPGERSTKEFTGLEVDTSRDTLGLPDPVATLQKYGNVIKYLGYSLRALAAGDAIFTRAGYEAEAALKVRAEGRKNGKRGEDLRRHVAQELFNSDADWKQALKEAESRRKILEKAKIKVTDRDVIANAWSILDKKRRSDVRAEAAYTAGIAWLNQDVNPRGYTGMISQLIASTFTPTLTFPGGKKVTNPAAIIQPFVNTTLKVANLTIDSTPLGFGKAAIGKYRVKEPGNLVRQQLGSAIIGTASMGILYAALKANGDDKDPFFDIIGPAPKSPAEKAKFYASKRKPWSIKYGNYTVSFLYTPWIGPLGSVAMLRDKVRNGSLDEKTGLEIAGILAFSNLRAFADVPVLKTLTGIVEAISTGEDRGDAFSNLAAGVTRNFIPGIAIAEEITRAYDNPITTRNDFWAKVFRGIPIAQSYAGKPALNIWGEPVNPEWYERLPVVGSAVGRFVGIETEDPDTLWLMNNGYNITGIENKITIDSKDVKWNSTKEARKKNLGAVYDDVLTDEEQYKLQEQAGPLYKKKVSEYRQRYGDHGFNEKIQDNLKKDLTDIKTRLKYRLFVEGAR